MILSKTLFKDTVHLTDSILYVFLLLRQNMVLLLLAVLDPRVGHTMDVLSPFIPVLCHSD